MENASSSLLYFGLAHQGLGDVHRANISIIFKETCAKSQSHIEASVFHGFLLLSE